MRKLRFLYSIQDQLTVYTLRFPNNLAPHHMLLLRLHRRQVRVKQRRAPLNCLATRKIALILSQFQEIRAILLLFDRFSQLSLQNRILKLHKIQSYTIVLPKCVITSGIRVPQHVQRFSDNQEFAKIDLSAVPEPLVNDGILNNRRYELQSQFLSLGLCLLHHFSNFMLPQLFKDLFSHFLRVKMVFDLQLHNFYLVYERLTFFIEMAFSYSFREKFFYCGLCLPS